jgi:FHA domain
MPRQRRVSPVDGPTFIDPSRIESADMTNQRKFTIGRSPECDLVLADTSVSRRHAEMLVLDDGQVFLVDCQSTHGTRVSRHGQMRQVQQEFVEPDAVVHFGDVSLPMRDLMDALRTKHPGVSLPPPVEPRGNGQQGWTWERGTRLVRCSCGVVKRKGQRCSQCGE